MNYLRLLWKKGVQFMDMLISKSCKHMIHSYTKPSRETRLKCKRIGEKFKFKYVRKQFLQIHTKDKIDNNLSIWKKRDGK